MALTATTPKAMERITVTYRVVTPMFCGGSDRDKAELRLPSFKGMLRWWWRALAWSDCAGDLVEVRRREDDLFGSPDGGHSKVVMRLASIPRSAMREPPEQLHDGDRGVIGDGARYLGYGVVEAFGNQQKRTERGQLLRACLVAPFDVTIELRCRALGDQRALLLAALRAIGLLGGLGARSRRGYGSLVLRGLSCDGAPSWSPARSIEDLEREIASLVAAAASARELPDYTALSARTRIVLVPATSGEKSPLQMLDRVGREMMRYRSWGHEGRVFGNDSEKNFRGDHDLMKQDPQLRRRHPARVVFGLPHNYGKPLENRVDPADPDDGDRRASPLLIHVHDCDAGPIAVLSFLPARFLSRGNRAKINVGGKAVPIASDDELWRPIERLLTRFRAGPPERVESFGHAKEVRWP